MIKKFHILLGIWIVLEILYIICWIIMSSIAFRIDYWYIFISVVQIIFVFPALSLAWWFALYRSKVANIAVFAITTLVTIAFMAIAMFYIVQMRFGIFMIDIYCIPVMVVLWFVLLCVMEAHVLRNYNSIIVYLKRAKNSYM